MVAAGDGMRSLFEGLGAHVVDGGPTLNPSTYEILAGIHEVTSEEVLVLPNSPNVILAAQEAAKLSEKPVRVVPSRSQQAALAALVELAADEDAATNAELLEAALAEIRSGAVAPAAARRRPGALRPRGRGGLRRGRGRRLGRRRVDAVGDDRARRRGC